MPTITKRQQAAASTTSGSRKMGGGPKAAPNRVNLSDQNIRRSSPRDTAYRIWDTKVPGLVMRVLPSGVKSFNVAWSRSSSKAIGKYPAMTVEMARTQALGILQDAAKHGTPEFARKRPNSGTLRQFLDNDLAPWAIEHRKWGAGSIKRIKSAFEDLLDRPLTELNAWIIERWRSQRLKAGISDGTINRELAALKAALARAVEWGALSTNPLTPVKLRQVDNARVRYLSVAEEKRLRAVLVRRDRAAVAVRTRANILRARRGRSQRPALAAGAYRDHLTPIVLLALNSGLRRGELVTLEWGDVNLRRKSLYVRAAAAKSGKSRHVPLNKESVAVLKQWRRQQSGNGRVFNVRDVKTAWRALIREAAIEGFTFHDLRHSFASNLVMAGVDLNTVRELLGHADLKMTLRYSHLANEHKAAAVEKLVATR